jgi:hypothetical protein
MESVAVPTVSIVCQIPGNPDIAGSFLPDMAMYTINDLLIGVGVRLSAYVQVILVLFNVLYSSYRALSGRTVSFILPKPARSRSTQSAEGRVPGYSKQTDRKSTPWDESSWVEEGSPSISNAENRDESDLDEYLGMERTLGLSIILIGIATIISAVIEIFTDGLTAYHALVIINLSLINSGAWLAISALRLSVVLNNEHWTRRDFLGANSWGIVHWVMTSLFALYFWFNIDKFFGYGETPCQHVTFYWLFFPINIQNNVLILASRIFYALEVGALGVFGLLLTLLLVILSIFSAFSIIRIGVSSRSRSVDDTHDLESDDMKYTFPPLRTLVKSSLTYATTALGVLITVCIIFLIFSTEATIQANGPHVDVDQENNWTFGQTLTLMSALVGLALYARDFRKWWIKQKQRRMNGL